MIKPHCPRCGCAELSGIGTMNCLECGLKFPLETADAFDGDSEPDWSEPDGRETAEHSDLSELFGKDQGH